MLDSDEDHFVYFKKYWLFILTFLLLFFTVFLFYLDWQNSNRKLTFVMLDIGQGDALFIESPNGTQVLIDGGPKNNLAKELPKFMPFWDRDIDVIFITNPDADHISGFLNILKNYKVGAVFEPGTFNSSSIYKKIETEIKNQKIPNILAKKGMILDIGGGAYIEVLFPDRDVSTWEVNEGSIVMKLVYGDTSIMLTGDAPMSTERILLVENSPEFLDVDILKVGHHGSYTSTSSDFVKTLSPKYALVSDGKGNSYGHPHLETLATLKNLGAEIFRTDLFGNIVMKSDGQKETFSFIK